MKRILAYRQYLFGRFLLATGALAVVFLSAGMSPTAATAGETAGSQRRPNVVFILADDLGYGDVGCYGQKKIRTPNIDRLAAEGARFTAHYAGNNVCAPSRCVLMTGLHPGHAFIRDNKQAKAIGLPFDEGQVPVPAGSLQLPLKLHQLGYRVGGFGKWGLGPVGSSGDPLKQGFDRFFGFNCQAVAHNYYPTQLWDDDRPAALNNPRFAAHQKLPAGADPRAAESYVPFRGNEYAPDRIAAEARTFLQANRDRPFFLYFPTTVPHLALQVPDDSLAEYAGKFPEEPYAGGRGYLPHRTPRAAYAAMITRMDREVGRLIDLVAEMGLDQRTIFVFASDNGPLYDQTGGTDCEFFNSAGGFRGRKGSFYEGGFRVPCIVRWKGHIAAGTVCDRVTGFEDWLPTLLEMVEAKDATPAGLDGISFAPTLLGKPQPPRPFLYRETPGYGGQQCARVGDWKLLRRNLSRAPKSKDKPTTELYNLADDPAESRDRAAEHPEIVARLEAIAAREHAPAESWPLRALDEPKSAMER